MVTVRMGGCWWPNINHIESSLAPLTPSASRVYRPEHPALQARAYVCVFSPSR
jgi:hypothetical protein